MSDPAHKTDVASLLNDLKSNQAEVRRMAALKLGKTQDSRVVETLISALRNSESQVRAAAAWSLGELGDARAVEPLIYLFRDNDEDVRMTAASSLSPELSAFALEPLINLLSNLTESSQVRVTAAWALFEIKDPAALDILIDNLKDIDPEVRRSCAETSRASWR